MSGGAPGSPRARAWALVTLFALGCAGRGAAGGASAAANGGTPPPRSFGERCVGQPSKSNDGLLVSCDDGAFAFIVPGTDWTVEASPAPSVVVFASSGPLNLSVRSADESEGQLDPHAHLEGILRGVSAALAEQGHQVSSPRLEESKDGAVVLWYEVSVAADEGEALRMVNAWNAVRGADGRYLDYHVSFTAAADDPVWKTEPASAGPAARMVDLAAAFVVRPAAR